MEDMYFQSNRIEEIANTLVNVLQHHSKASSSTTASTPLAIMSGTHQIHASAYSTQRSAEDAYDSARHHFSKLSSSLGKRTKWPWGVLHLFYHVMFLYKFNLEIENTEARVGDVLSPRLL